MSQFWGWVLNGKVENVIFVTFHLGFTGGKDGKEFFCNAGDLGSIPAVFLPGEFHGQRSLKGYSS